MESQLRQKFLSSREIFSELSSPGWNSALGSFLRISAQTNAFLTPRICGSGCGSNGAQDYERFHKSFAQRSHDVRIGAHYTPGNTHVSRSQRAESLSMAIVDKNAHVGRSVRMSHISNVKNMHVKMGRFGFRCIAFDARVSIDWWWIVHGFAPRQIQNIY